MGLLGAFVPQAVSPTAAATPARPPVVIAIVERGGMNVLHRDFERLPRESATPIAGIPDRKMIRLPTSGSFKDRLAQAREGELGHLEPGRLYGIAGTRIAAIYTPPEEATSWNIFRDRVHATGTTSSAVGLAHGTNPHAQIVFVAGTDAATWRWLARQKWIDIISTSYSRVTVDSNSPFASTCGAARAIREIVKQGRLIFSSSGNVGQVGLVAEPSGVPETYQVGGVDKNGDTYRPSDEEPSSSVTPTRPYETGDRFVFDSADADSLGGSMPFGGTSGAAPSTAGRAAALIQHARSILGSSYTGAREGALARSDDPSTFPTTGPLRDGRLTANELAQVMHRIAEPAEPPSPARYLVEGYGALTSNSINRAREVIAGVRSLPERPEEDSMHEFVETARASVFSESRCGS